MRRFGHRPALFLAALTALTLSALPAAAHPDDEAGKDNRRGTQGVQQDGVPGESHGVEVVGHVDPGGGFHADVVAHKGHA